MVMNIFIEREMAMKNGPLVSILSVYFLFPALASPENP
jgi:hypothetical protein